MSLATAKISTLQDGYGSWWAYAKLASGKTIQAFGDTEEEALYVLRIVEAFNPDRHDMGDLWIRRLPGGRFAGDRMSDMTILRHLLGWPYFSEDDYDRVLRIVSQVGYTLAEKIKEDG